MNNAKIIFYFNQFYVIRLGEKVYHYNAKLEYFAIFRAFFTLLIHAFKSRPCASSGSKIENKYRQLVYVETINQKNALIDIFLAKENKKETIFILNDINEKLIIPQFDQKDFPTKISFWKSLKYFPKALFISPKYIKSQKGKVNKVHILINLSLFLAYIDVFKRQIKEYGIKQVVVTNDHNLHTLALLLASRTLMVKSIYIQHASVSPAFPKLLPDISLLEGQQALDTYNKIGNLSKIIKLVGIPRLDSILKEKYSLRTQNIIVGFCLKPYYSDELIENYIKIISTIQSVKTIIVRPHPGNNEKFYDRLKKYPIEISNARKERPHEFIKKLDVLISGESSIILESSLMKIKTLYIDDKVAQYDLYGFVKNGVTTPVLSNNDLVREISSLDLNIVEKQYLNCKYYCSTVNTEYENRSKELILKYLNDVK